MQHLQPNTTLQGGKYRIERVLGQGGFGITYLAEQVSLNRKVAIKEFFMKDYCARGVDTRTMTSPSTGSNNLVELYRKKFVKEAQNLAKLHHPNIISVIEVFEENDTVYYSMPYLSGGSLYDLVKAHGALTEDVAMNYIRQIAKALKYMHEEKHLCHYDVKPSNILLDRSGKAVLIDFGISKNYDASGHETSTTPIGLSEGYAPIEQYQQNLAEFSPVSDVYALGATLYYLTHGRRPVSAIHRISGIPLIIKNSLSANAKAIINASLKVSKTERPQNMDVFFGRNIFKTSVLEDNNGQDTTVERRKAIGNGQTFYDLSKSHETKSADKPRIYSSYENWLLETFRRIFDKDIIRTSGADIDILNDLHATPVQIDKLQFDIEYKYGWKMPRTLRTFDAICAWLIASACQSKLSGDLNSPMDDERTIINKNKEKEDDTFKKKEEDKKEEGDKKEIGFFEYIQYLSVIMLPAAIIVFVLNIIAIPFGLPVINTNVDSLKDFMSDSNMVWLAIFVGVTLITALFDSLTRKK